MLFLDRRKYPASGTTPGDDLWKDSGVKISEDPRRWLRCKELFLRWCFIISHPRFTVTWARGEIIPRSSVVLHRISRMSVSQSVLFRWECHRSPAAANDNHFPASAKVYYFFWECFSLSQIDRPSLIVVVEIIHFRVSLSLPQEGFPFPERQFSTFRMCRGCINVHSSHTGVMVKTAASVIVYAFRFRRCCHWKRDFMAFGELCLECRQG